MSNPESLSVANTILAQLGGNRALMMLGASSVLGAADSLQMRIKGTSYCNSIRIVLDASDTYTVEFWKVRGAKCAQVASVPFVYASDLGTLIAARTGLYLSLGTMGA